MKVLKNVGLTLGALLVLVPLASADPITYGYFVTSTGVVNNSNYTLATAGFTIFPQGDVTDVTSPGGFSVSVTPRFAHPGSPPTGPAVFANAPITVSETITDETAKAVAGAIPQRTLTWNGYVSGTVFVGPNNGGDLNFTWDRIAQLVTLGSPGNWHAFTLGAPSSPGASPNDVYNPTFAVAASNYQPGIDPAPGVVTSVSAAPEPTSLLLAAVAVPALLVVRYKRRRRSLPERPAGGKRGAEGRTAFEVRRSGAMH